MNGFVTSVSRGKGKCAAETQRFTAACRPFLGPQHQPDVLSYHTGKEIPNYWAYAKHYLLQDRMFAPGGLLDAAVTSVPVLRLVGATAPTRPTR